jgi:endoglucanase
LGRFTVPQTGGMQGWKTINVIASLPAGNQTLRIFAEKGGWNFNWFEGKRIPAIDWQNGSGNFRRSK